MNLHSSTKRKPTVLSKRISLAGFTAVAAAALMFSAESASAKDTKELAALKKALATLGTNVTVDNATPDQLSQAVALVIGTNTKIAGLVAGEALKTTAALANDAGDEIAQAALAKVGGATASSVVVQKLISDAAKTAGTKTKADVGEVSAFTAALLDGSSQAGQAIAVNAAAAIAASAKASAGAILAGAASEITNADAQAQDQARATFAVTALANKKVAVAATDVSRLVAGTASDSVAFAKSVAEGASEKLALKIVPGLVAAAPEKAGDITGGLLNSTDTALKTTLQKGAALLAKGVSAVADIEQISVVGSYIADQIGSGAVKTSAAAGIAKTLAKAIISKPSDGRYRTTAANKKDEIAEVAAYVVGGILNNSGFTKKAAPKLVLAVIKSAISGAATSKKTAALAPATGYIADIVGSVALTIQSAFENQKIAQDVRDEIQKLLVKSAKSLAGKITTADAVNAALTLGFGGTDEAKAKLENGTLRSAADLLALVDPETPDKNY